MNIIFLTLYKIRNLRQEDLYSDLMNTFRAHGHNVYIVTPVEKKENIKPFLKHGKNYELLGVPIGNYFNVGSIEKGLTLLTLENNYQILINRVWNNVHFDLLLYSTPPITFNRIIKYYKRFGVPTYLMLKDIFPQNAVDIGMMTKNGVKGLIYYYFRSHERELYRLSDTIGCMSEANIKYLLEHNPDVKSCKVEICPNSVTLRARNTLDRTEKYKVREKYRIPTDKTVFVYGGNLGLPQGPDFILKCLEANEREKILSSLSLGVEVNTIGLKSGFKR